VKSGEGRLGERLGQMVRPEVRRVGKDRNENGVKRGKEILFQMVEGQ